MTNLTDSSVARFSLSLDDFCQEVRLTDDRRQLRLMLKYMHNVIVIIHPEIHRKTLGLVMFLDVGTRSTQINVPLN